MGKLKRWVLATAAAITFSGATPAEDIDIYSAIQPDGARPNLLMLLDNSAAWDASTSFNCTGFTVPANNAGKAVGFEQCALHKAVTAIANSEALVGNINMGLMLFGRGSNQGGALLVPSGSPYTLPRMTTAAITSLANTVAGLDRNNDKSNGSATGASMQEAWAFYSGHRGISGTNYGTTNLGGACQRNFVVYIANANNASKPQDTGNIASDALSDAGATAAQKTQIDIPAPYDKYENNWADEWARFMKETDLSPTLAGNQNIITYTIIVTDGKNPDYVQFLQTMASAGGGKSFQITLGDMDALVQALLQIFNEVQGVNSAFSSSSLPVSANAQGEYLNQVFMGVFRPDTGALPRWQGNLKQYKLGPNPGNTTDTILIDADGNNAVASTGTGFISPNARSFWTSKNTSALPDSIGGFWVNNPQGISGGFDSVDGEIVEKGGAHQRLRLSHLFEDYSAPPASARKLYTCTSGCAPGTPGSALSATPFAVSNSNITASLLGSTAPAVAIASIKRDDTTGRALVTLGATPNPALTSGQTVTISGATNAAFNGTFALSLIDATHFTIPVAATEINPPSSPTGVFQAQPKAASVLNVTSLTRSGTTATVTTAAAHNLVSTQTVTIAGALQAAYNGNFVIAVTGSNTFTYILAEAPGTPSTGGIVALGATAVSNCAANATNCFSFAVGNVSTTNLTATTKRVMITNSANGNTPPKSWVAGNVVTLSGMTPAAYNSTQILTGVGNGCPGGTNNKSICFVVSTTPATPAIGLITATPLISSSAQSVQLTRANSTCAVGAAPGYTSSGSTTVNATATTAAPHGFANGQLIDISGTVGSPAEGAYIKSGVAVTVTAASATTFTYPVTVTPACSDATAGLTATPSGVNRDTLIRWLRGEDNAFDEPSPQIAHTSINIRPSVHGDVLHSRPIIINYGGNIGVVAFYGANDGVFRAVNGNQTNPTGSSLPAPGDELWGFVAPEFFPRLNRLRTNSPQILLSGTPGGITPTPQPKDYFFDGSTGAYQNTVTGKVYLYLSARRGGRLIYALDVSDPLTPKFMWKRTNTDTGFAELGQTWSQPKIARVRSWSNPVVIFGAGYDPNEDLEPAIADTQGRGIFMLDALTGQIVWQAQAGGAGNHCAGTPCALSGMTYAMPSDVTLIDRDRDGYIDRVYAPDLGGNIWRVDLEPIQCTVSGTNDCTAFDIAQQNPPSAWQTTLFASVGGSVNNSDKRKLFYPPSVVPTLTYDAVMVATGDREHPVANDQAVNVKNRFYMLKDTNIGKDGRKAPDGSAWIPVTDNSSSTAFASTADLFNATSVAYDTSVRGFYINLTRTGEKAVNAPVTVGGNTYFATNSPIAPDPNTCQANLGEAHRYQVNFFTATSQDVVFPGGGMPPTAVVATVRLDNGLTRQVCIGCGGQDAPPGASNTPPLIGAPRQRSFWFEKR